MVRFIFVISTMTLTIAFCAQTVHILLDKLEEWIDLVEEREDEF